MCKLIQKLKRKILPRDIVLYGAGGFGREVAFLIEAINKARLFPKYRLLGFVDDGLYEPGKTVNGYPILGTGEWLVRHRDEVVCACTVATSGAVRKELQERLVGQGVRLETLIAPDVSVHPTTSVGVGAIICDCVLLSVNMKIGDGVVINCRTNLGHDVTVGDYAIIMGACNITGGVTVGSCAYIGGGAYVIPGRKIGEGSLVAAGSVVFTHVKAGTKVLGNPAKRIDI